MPKKQKQKPERRPDQGDDFVLLIDSPHWKPGVVLQVMITGLDSLYAFKEKCQRDGLTVLVCQAAPKGDPRESRYLTNKEARQALKVRGLLTPERKSNLEWGFAPLQVDPTKPI